ncbi:MAG TPA: PEP-CTERM sorting domain-containing protein [Candidatus Dormibacteraeota bacterium]|nr:PEP-CTERM sorting domain-containing protein [Candidatus Dormibacteraeota bacterium]
MKSIRLPEFCSGFAAAVMLASLSFSSASAGIIFTDGFGDGDRDNNGLDTGAVVTDPLDIGIPWLLTDGTSAVNFRAIDDSAGIGTGNALQLNNTGANNRPSVGHFSPITMADGDQLILRFDARLVSTSANADRAIRWGLYHDTSGDDGTVDHGSTSSLSVDDTGYNVRVDAGADVSNGTSMDVTRDDSATGTSIIQATTTGLGIASANAADQLKDALKHHFELSLTRSGTSMLISLQEDGNAAISGTDASPVGFVFDEIALGVRSSAAMDMRFDNIQLEYNTLVPEPGTFGLFALGAGGLLIWRRRQAAETLPL